MFNTRVITCAFAAASVLLIVSQAMAQTQGSPTMAQGGPNVTVVNTPLPVTVTNPAALAAANAQAIALALGVGTPVAFTLGGRQITYQVQLGKRLVIEYVSGSCVPNAVVVGQPPFYDQSVVISAITNGVTNQHGIAFPINPIPYLATDPAPRSLVVGHLVKIYADQGTNVTMSSNCFLTFSGQLVTP